MNQAASTYWFDSSAAAVTSISWSESCLVSTILLPFFRSVATVAVAGENGIAGNVYSCCIHIGMK